MNLRHILGISSLLSVAISAFVIITARQDAQTKRPGEDEPTVVQKGILTDKQRRHSREFEDREVPGIRTNKSDKVGVYIDIEPGPLPDKTNPKNASEYLRALTCSSVTDAVVVGTVLGKASQLTENAHFVFTDYDVELLDVLKQPVRKDLKIRNTITITDPGGTVQVDGRIVFVKINRENPLRIGQQYILFLRSLEDSDTYRVIGERGIFSIAAGQVKPTYYRFEERFTATDIVEQLRSIAPTCFQEK